MKRWRISLLWALVALLTLTTWQPVLAAPVANTTYIVQAGDTLTRIAARYGLSLSQLAAANGLGWNSWVYAGQRLIIPTSAPLNPAPAPSGTTYVVQRGDTLVSIAARYGVSVSELATLNGLYWNSWVYVGQRLAIPGGQASPAPDNPTPPSTGDQVYVVQPGNTLFSIARAYGTTVSALSSVNGLVSNTIYVGQRLKIPGGSNTPSQPPAPQPTPQPTPNPGNGRREVDRCEPLPAADHGV